MVWQLSSLYGVETLVFNESDYFSPQNNIMNNLYVQKWCYPKNELYLIAMLGSKGAYTCETQKPCQRILHLCLHLLMPHFAEMDVLQDWRW